ncbi:lysophosphatidic acid receptor 5a [Polypterus senegalus]|uniref:lysophosphatidic acid receptor 5a n=1 Tax=Polypterus senegalus TaxID=55291 RepID=UPI001963A297|nr:lysophosphatidic acid receptor 5a [Polypterus senegalus]
MANFSCVSTNATYPHILYTTVYSVVLVIGLPCNAVSLWIFFRRLGLQSTPLIYMTNLAISDLLFVISLPLRIFYFATGWWPFGDILCMIPGTLFSVNIYSSSFFIGLISLDRLFAVIYPLRSRNIRTPYFAKLACGFVWVFIFTISIPIALNHKANKDSCNVTRCFEAYSVESWKNGFIMFCLLTAIGILVPFLLIAISTVGVLKTIKSKSIGMEAFDKQKMACMFLMNLLMYAICFVPFHIICILYSLNKLGFLHNDYTRAQIIGLCLASSNSCLDPLIYYFTTDAFWKKKTEQMDLASTQSKLPTVSLLKCELSV